MKRKITTSKGFMRIVPLLAAGALTIGLAGGCSNTAVNTEPDFAAITNAQIFDGEKTIEATTVVIRDGSIQSVGGEIPEGAAVIDAAGKTLLPGLIDSHTHTDMNGLRDALKFGVTTELEMNGSWSKSDRKKITESSDVADLRSSGMGITSKGGHPSEYQSSSENLLIRYFFKFPSASTPEEATKLVSKRVNEGADYIKILVENGDNIGYPGLPVLDDDTLQAAIDEARRLDKLTIAHTTTAAETERVVAAGINGLGHLFFDDQPSDELVADIVSSDVFIIPTLVTLSTAFGNDAAWLAEDARVSPKLSKEWLESLSASANVYPEGKMESAYATVMTLRDAGVDILAGSDVSEPVPGLGGLAHGASLHHELMLLVEAGLTPADALRAATSVPARRFSLDDRGRILPGARADLLLIDGDPLTDISDTLNIDTIWRGGVKLADMRQPGR
ncbi:MAG: amidohydrolase family protein [Clostridiales bacterium]|jgi:imidazolonepropionase-like amidohydrolase|nr:amidohydrolase family protein [Clostridiales bacterium]